MEIEIRRWGMSPDAIKHTLEQQGTVYRDGKYSGLISPSSVYLSRSLAAQLQTEMSAVWEWNRQWHELYSEHLVGGEESHWLVQSSEWGLPTKALAVQRLPDIIQRDPHVGRVDSVALEPKQQVVEVQWKGGGEGFAAGVQDAYLHLSAVSAGEQPLGGLLLDTWADFFKSHARRDPAFVVNSSRETWLPSEEFLVSALRARGVEFLFVPRSKIGAAIKARNQGVQARFRSGWESIDFLYLDRLSEALPTDLFESVVKAYRDGRVHVEPPPTYLYSQKFGFVLPFHAEYRHRFPDVVREILVPSVLMNAPPTDLSAVIAKVHHPSSALLGDMKSWSELQRLPVGLRRQLVVKCASINGRLNNAGRGVWRLGSPTTLESVLSRVRSRNEPWILQPYVNRTWKVPLAHPELSSSRDYPAHARFLIYVAHTKANPHLLGGLVTFSTFWKAAGKDAYVINGDRVGGSAFVDIRVRQLEKSLSRRITATGLAH